MPHAQLEGEQFASIHLQRNMNMVEYKWLVIMYLTSLFLFGMKYSCTIHVFATCHLHLLGPNRFLRYEINIFTLTMMNILK